MKLHLEQHGGIHLITARTAHYIDVNHKRHEGPIVVAPQRVEPWAVDHFDALTEADFAQLAALGHAITLIGTGSRQRFPQIELLKPLIVAQRGYEVMDTAAACRTYNILAAEGRSVCAALLLDH